MIGLACCPGAVIMGIGTGPGVPEGTVAPCCSGEMVRDASKASGLAASSLGITGVRGDPVPP